MNPPKPPLNPPQPISIMKMLQQTTTAATSVIKYFTFIVANRPLLMLIIMTVALNRREKFKLAMFVLDS